LKKQFIKIVWFVIIIFFSLGLKAQNTDFNLDSNFIKTDSLALNNVQDSFPRTDSLSWKKKNRTDAITEIINYSGIDSMMFSMNDQMIYLYGTAYLETAGTELTAGRIEINMKASELSANGYEDSTGTILEKPVFKDGDQTFTCLSMKYNFKTKRGIIRDVKTEQADGFLHGTVTKIQPNKEVHILHGKYTTCNEDHPHFYIELTKAKVIPDKKIVAGPLYFVILDVPLYVIGLPFGFFPTKQKKANGIIMPTYKNEYNNRGFGISHGGYYFAMNDYYDLTVLGDIFSSGSWGTSVASTFKKRYKYSGTAFVEYSNTSLEERRIINSDQVPDSLKTPNRQSLRVTMSYTQDPKRNPTSNFGFNVNLDLGGFSKINAESINEYVNTTTSSSVSYQKSFPETPFNFSVSANGVQNLNDKTINLKLPTASLNMRSIPLIKRKVKTGKWYEDFAISFTSNFDNTINTRDSLIVADPNQVLRDMQYGFRYSAPLSTAFNILKFVTCNPSLNYTGRMYPNYISQNYIIDSLGQRKLIIDTIPGVKHNLDFSLNVPFSTTIYGLVEVKKLKFKPLKNLLDNLGLIAFRHVATPSITYGYKPDFSTDFWKYYSRPIDSIPYQSTAYNIFSNGIFGAPSIGEQQSIMLSLGNSFQMKVKNKKDTVTNEKKIKILDRLYLSSSYNFAADSLQLSPLSISGGTTIFNSTSVNFGGTLDPYAIDPITGIRINDYEIIKNHNLGRFTNGNISLSTSFDQNTISNFLKYKKEDFYDQGYNYYNVPWSVSGNYIFQYNKIFNPTTQKNQVTITQNATFSLQLTPTPKWKISVSSGYDINAQKITSTNIAMTRDLHCWNMSFSCVPFGKLKSYDFHLAINSALFKGIEYKRGESWQNSGF